MARAAPSATHAQRDRRSRARHAAQAATAQAATYGPSIVISTAETWKIGASSVHTAAKKPARRSPVVSTARHAIASVTTIDASTAGNRTANSVSPNTIVAARIASAIPGPLL